MEGESGSEEEEAEAAVIARGEDPEGRGTGEESRHVEHEHAGLA